MRLGLEGKTVIITGGAGGIGKEAAKAFLREGAAVAVFARTKEKVDNFLREMHGQGFQKVYGEVLDVTDQEGVRCFLETVCQEFGTVDVWINNAGIAIDKPFLEYTENEWDTIMNTDLKAVWNCIRLVAPIMMKQERGVIINISSFASKIPSAGGAIYGAAKSGVSSLTRTLAAELAPYHIRVLGVVPGMIDTEISKANIEENGEQLVQNVSLGRLGTAEDLAGPIVFLASEQAEYMSGFDLEVTGGKFAVQNTRWAWKAKESLI
ncbi:MAG: SDR family oxidoreductase [Clostridia bacterium]|nr:SDR family oxidoreductase [Clostridia bacterium]